MSVSASPEITRKALAEEVGDVAHPAGGAEQLLLVAVVELDPEPGAVAEAVADQLREPVQVGDHLGRSRGGAGAARMCSITGRSATGTIGFGIS